MAAHLARTDEGQKNDRINRMQQIYANSFDDEQKVWAGELLEIDSNR